MHDQQFPDTPRGRYAASVGGRCPVHGVPLEVGDGYRCRMDLFPSRQFEEQQMANPFCLDLGESLQARPGYDAAVVIWCAECVATTGQ